MADFWTENKGLKFQNDPLPGVRVVYTRKLWQVCAVWVSSMRDSGYLAEQKIGDRAVETILS